MWFARKKSNRTGTISVVVVDKSRSGFKKVKSFGVAKTDEKAARLYVKASGWIRRFDGQQEIDFALCSIVQQDYLESGHVLNNISAVPKFLISANWPCFLLITTTVVEPKRFLLLRMNMVQIYGEKARFTKLFS